MAPFAPIRHLGFLTRSSCQPISYFELSRRSPGDRVEWRHAVYLGIYDLALALAELEKHFGREPDASGESAPGQACLAAFMDTAQAVPGLVAATSRIGIGGRRVSRAVPLPHHRTCGSASGGSEN